MNPVNSKSGTLAVVAMLCVSSSAFALPTGIPIGMMELMARIAAAPNPNEMRVNDVSSVSQWMNSAPQGMSAPFMAEGHKFTLPEFTVTQYAPVYKMGAEPFQNSPVIPDFAGGAR
jgi:hypothetical protein